MSQWPESLSELIKQGKPSVLITIVDAKGSVPRGAGTKMIVTEQGIGYGTIGGGNLEYQCISMAQERLSMNSDDHWLRKLQRFPLGASLGQCCGGMVIVLLEYIEAVIPNWLSDLLESKADQVKVEIITPLKDQHKLKQVRPFLSSDVQVEAANQTAEYLYERVEPDDFNIMVFGAGHVGKALVHVLSGVECQVIWVDSRETEFPKIIPTNATKIVDPNPEDSVELAPVGSYFIVLTHSHRLDQLLCEAILKREDFRFCGLIGSQSKRKRFEHRLLDKGFSEQQIATLTCPIGIQSLSGKQPGHIAVAVVAQLLVFHESQRYLPESSRHLFLPPLS